MAGAAPAFAQELRDPFEPLVQEGTTTGTSAVEGTTVGGPVTGTVSQPTSDALPNTGGDISPWLAAAYGLVALGVAAVVWGRVRAPGIR